MQYLFWNMCSIYFLLVIRLQFPKKHRFTYSGCSIPQGPSKMETIWYPRERSMTQTWSMNSQELRSNTQIKTIHVKCNDCSAFHIPKLDKISANRTWYKTNTAHVYGIKAEFSTVVALWNMALKNTMKWGKSLHANATRLHVFIKYIFVHLHNTNLWLLTGKLGSLWDSMYSIADGKPDVHFTGIITQSQCILSEISRNQFSVGHQKSARLVGRVCEWDKV